MSYSRRQFWSGEAESWFEFTLDGPGIQRHLRSTPLPGPDFGSRSEGVRVNHWAPDSSAVRFVFPSATIMRATAAKDGS
ncbi:hypothetical protein [Paracoccus binzhouensis]|uniref:hypothetical protein n=1 Tax=Paracoccus binzhouensis TaxID=2796149 RepID=UPI0018EF1A20|nr:hypothetical protein [Paracoccus binzhouensis]